MIYDLKDALAIDYPGRGIIAGENEKGNLLLAYFLTGRSENSRNRVFVREEDSLRTKAFDDSLVSDPSLIIYRPYVCEKEKEILTNGDQTETILSSLRKGESFSSALSRRAYEPDAPSFTPRISVLADRRKNAPIELAILSKAPDSDACVRSFYSKERKKGIGYFIRTYEKNGSPLPSFRGDPIEVSLHGGAKEIAREIWSALTSENKIALFVREVTPKGEAFEEIVNRHGGKE